MTDKKYMTDNLIKVIDMKKFLGVILGVAAVAACSKSGVEYSEPGEIALNPVNEVSKTKATTEGTTFPQNNIIGVFAYQQELPAQSEAREFNDANVFLSNVQFKKDVTNWAGWNGTAHQRYNWPRSGSILFAAYSPYREGDAVTHAFSADGNTVTKDELSGDFTQPEDISKTVDFLWSPVTSNSYNVGTVNMEFKHAMAWITVMVRSNDTENTTIDVKNLTISGMNTKGSFKTNKGDISWTLSSEADDVKDIVAYNSVSGQRVTDSYTAVESTANGILVIPQDITDDMVLKLTYTYKYNNGATPDPITTTRELALKNLEDNTTAHNAITRWENGKHYIIEIQYGASNEILINPSVTDWTSVTASYTEGASASDTAPSTE